MDGPGNGPKLSPGICLDGIGEAQHTAHHLGIPVPPDVITDSSPCTTVQDLDGTLVEGVVCGHTVDHQTHRIVIGNQKDNITKEQGINKGICGANEGWVEP